MSRKDECTFPFLNFLIIGLCSSSANSLFEIFLILIPLSEVVLSKTIETIETRPFWYPSYFGQSSKNSKVSRQSK